MLRARMEKNRGGFTLIELMIVIVIIGILATLLIPRIMERPEEARRVKAKMDIKAIESALKLYKIDCGSYPTTEQGLISLLKKPETAPVPLKWREGGYLDGTDVPKDPWGNALLLYFPHNGREGLRNRELRPRRRAGRNRQGCGHYEP